MSQWLWSLVMQPVTVKEIDYVTFRGCRNLKDRNKHTIEDIFTVKKH